MNRFLIAEWADKKPGRWILIWCVLLGLFIFGSSLAPREAAEVHPVAEKKVTVTNLEAQDKSVKDMK